MVLEDDRFESSRKEAHASDLIRSSTNVSDLSSTTRLSYHVIIHPKGRLSTSRPRPVKEKDLENKFFKAIVGTEVADYCITEFKKRNDAAGNDTLLKTHANSIIKTIVNRYPDVTTRMLMKVFRIGMGRMQLIKKDRCYSEKKKF